MRVAFLYNEAAEDPAQFAEDDDPSRSPVVAALNRLGHEVTPVVCTLDLAQVRHQLDHAEPDVAFNRVESLGGSDAMATAIPLLLDALCIPYTGCCSRSIAATVSKVATKQQLVRAGLPTPEWIDVDFGFRIADFGLDVAFDNPQSAIRNPQYILKSVFEHASFDMDDTAVVGPAAPEKIAELVRNRTTLTGRPYFAERFVEGREFNISLLGQRPDVLPPAEIDFSAFPTAKPRIVGRGAKWDDASFEFHNTPRRFDFPMADAPLIRRLYDLSVECWQLFGLRGYARVDFRVDSAGRPWILEINTNPCIAPSSGFAAAVEQGGLSYDDAIQQIVEAALSHRKIPAATKRRPLAAR